MIKLLLKSTLLLLPLFLAVFLSLVGKRSVVVRIQKFRRMKNLNDCYNAFTITFVSVAHWHSAR